MKALAAGKDPTAILKLMRIIISIAQGNFGDVELDNECIRDIAEVVERDYQPGEE